MKRRTAIASAASFLGLGILASRGVSAEGQAGAAKPGGEAAKPAGEAAKPRPKDPIKGTPPREPAQTATPGAGAPGTLATEMPPTRPAEEVRALLAKQADEWSAGDLGAFCGHYADECMFFTSAGLIRGRHEVFSRYRRKYTGKESMGTLSIEVLDVAASDTVASAALAWTLTWLDRPPAERLKRGHSVVTLTRDSSRAWRIVYDASL